jgi:hypothetical protein
MSLRAKIGLAIGGKRTVSTVLALMVVKLLEAQGIAMPEGWQESLEIVLAGLTVVFLRLGVAKAEKASGGIGK